jgi:hypothetical protein
MGTLSADEQQMLAKKLRVSAPRFPPLTLGMFSAVAISSFLAIVNRLLASTYKPLCRTVAPKVNGSINFKS